jgi:hypothetical protein
VWRQEDVDVIIRREKGEVDKHGWGEEGEL